LYPISPDLSNEQIAKELDLASAMSVPGYGEKLVELSSQSDEVYITAEHKGHPAIIA
jgi:HSP20 family molecular chaperone IbpA